MILPLKIMNFGSAGGIGDDDDGSGGAFHARFMPVSLHSGLSLGIVLEHRQQRSWYELRWE